MRSPRRGRASSATSTATSCPAGTRPPTRSCCPRARSPGGFPLNEGAAAGLPLVATDAVGAARELIEDGVNGFRVPAGDVEALRGALRRLAEDEPFRRAAGQRSRELAARFTPDAWADAVAGPARETTRG